MKRFAKKLLVAALVMAMLFVFVPQNAEAAYPIGTISNPAKLGTKGKFKASFKYSYDDSDQNAYATFKMKKQGYVTISATKPRDSKGDPIQLQFYIYDSKGRQVWNCLTEGQRLLPTSKYTYYVGLKKGTYTIRAYIYSLYLLRDVSTTSTISISTTANSYWEIENNDTREKATTIKVNKKYTGVYCDNDFSAEDYFKVKLSKGKRYEIRLGSSGDLFSNNTTICCLYDPNLKDAVEDSKYHLSAAGKLTNSGRVIIKANKNGYYYIRLYNSSGANHSGIKYTLMVKKK